MLICVKWTDKIILSDFLCLLNSSPQLYIVRCNSVGCGPMRSFLSGPARLETRSGALVLETSWFMGPERGWGDDIIGSRNARYLCLFQSKFLESDLFIFPLKDKIRVSVLQLHNHRCAPLLCLISHYMVLTELANSHLPLVHKTVYHR
jgi:hypothetical protein